MKLVPMLNAALLIFFSLLAVVLFAAAGSFMYWQGWVFWFIFICWTGIISYYLLGKNPVLLQRRMLPEKAVSQQWLQSVNSFLFLLLLIIPARRFRHAGNEMPLILIAAGVLMMLSGFWIAFAVFRQNNYLSASVQTFPDQKVVDEGLYAYIRHPMYAGAMLIILGTPLVLGAFRGFIPAVLLVISVIFRAVMEEHLLCGELPGYRAYLEKVKYRFIPYLV